MVRLALEVLTVLGTLCAIGYYVLCLWSARSFLRHKPPAGNFSPPVSILKPLRDADPGAYECLRSHCVQEYPEYEIIFGVNDEQDPAVALVERLIAEFPTRAIRLVVSREALGANLKVSNLVQMLAVARYEHLLINDGDILAPPDYLQRVMAPFADPRTGMVTTLYRGIPANTLGSRLESLGISTDFMAGVLAARQLEGGIRFGLGATLALHRRALAAIGGLEPLVDYLADDYELGKRIAEAGYQVVLSEVVVDTHLPAYSLQGFLEHQLRWGRGIRDSRTAGYTGLLLTFGLPWALLAVIAARGTPWAWALLGMTALVRFVLAVVLGRAVLQDSYVLRNLWLIPLRDVVALLVWIGSLAGHTVAWRGDQFILKDGKLRPA